MPRIPLRLIVSICVTTLGLVLLLWSFAPSQRVQRRQIILPKQMQVAGAEIPETRMLTLDYPASVRAGDAERLRMTVEAQQQATAAGIANVYETHQVLAEAHFDMAGVSVRPRDMVSEPLLPGQRATFFWSIRPGESGRTQGTVWLYLRYIPKAGGPEIRQPISAQTIEIDSTTFFGLRSEMVQTIGLPGFFLGAILGFSFFVDAIKWLLKKKHHEDTESTEF